MNGSNTPNPRFDDSDYNRRKKWKNIWPSSGRQILLGKTTEEIAAGSTGTVEIYSGPHGSEEGTGSTKEPRNRGGVISSGLWVYLIPIGSGYDVVPAECNPE